jgi:hypothetical protein
MLILADRAKIFTFFYRTRMLIALSRTHCCESLILTVALRTYLISSSGLHLGLPELILVVLLCFLLLKNIVTC